MEVVIRPNAADAADFMARLIAMQLRGNPRLVLGLATGSTMESVYARLAQMHRDERLDFSKCRAFNLDEYVGVPASDPASYSAYMRRHLFARVNIPKRHAHLPNGMAADLAAECVRYERLIAARGGIDLQILGIGQTGHLGFNEPLSALRSRTRVKVLSPVTLRQNARFFRAPDEVPHLAITVGVGTILDSRRCLLLATGERKAEIAAKAIEGPLTSMISASALQMHPDCVVILDEAAAGRLTGADYYRWIYDHEPKWDPFRHPPAPPQK